MGRVQLAAEGHKVVNMMIILQLSFQECIGLLN